MKKKEIKAAAEELYLARKERDMAKEAFRVHMAAEGDGCEKVDDWRTTPCYHMDSPLEDWCETCQGSQPLYLERKKAGVRVAVAMRRLMFLCGKSVAR